MQIEQFQRFSSFCHSDGRRTTSKDNLVFCSNYLTDRTKRINLIRVIQGSCYIHASGKKKGVERMRDLCEFSCVQ